MPSISEDNKELWGLSMLKCSKSINSTSFNKHYWGSTMCQLLYTGNAWVNYTEFVHQFCGATGKRACTQLTVTRDKCFTRRLITCCGNKEERVVNFLWRWGEDAEIRESYMSFTIFTFNSIYYLSKIFLWFSLLLPSQP